MFGIIVLLLLSENTGVESVNLFQLQSVVRIVVLIYQFLIFFFFFSVSFLGLFIVCDSFCHQFIQFPVSLRAISLYSGTFPLGLPRPLPPVPCFLLHSCLPSSLWSWLLHRSFLSRCDHVRNKRIKGPFDNEKTAALIQPRNF